MSLNTFIPSYFCENTTREFSASFGKTDTCQLVGLQLRVQKDQQKKKSQFRSALVS